MYLLQQKLPFESSKETKLERKAEVREAVGKLEPNIKGIVDPDARDFVLNLLKKDPKQRLKDVLNHPFLKDAPAEPSFFPAATPPTAKKFDCNKGGATAGIDCSYTLQEQCLRIPSLKHLEEVCRI